MKSWIKYLLPNDEYKKQKLLNFLAEGFVISILMSVVFMLAETIFSLNMDASIALFIPVVVSITYILIGYVSSGTEFSNVATSTDFQSERRKIVGSSITFGFIFSLLSILVTGLPKTIGDLITLSGLGVIACILMFLLNMFSLHRSYKKNKDLLDDEY
ncbi:hypothetical protein J26TS2_30890 [Shouchella clausii]|uniref:DUF3278 domain-containing protein n=1 Tax=Shouchella tritolerans TaxID=2979466 RepID=UPI000787FD7F|nr:DUF3278 domain-containing protein [Shouchella tritolerans]GIN13222.1 hypothetical protein J26TS2_30890 [Shouchella clausii]